MTQFKKFLVIIAIIIISMYGYHSYITSELYKNFHGSADYILLIFIILMLFIIISGLLDYYVRLYKKEEEIYKERLIFYKKVWEKTKKYWGI